MIKFPEHEASLYLTHNDHRSCYLTVAQAIENDDFGYKDEDWVSKEQKTKAIATNECWRLQVYPETPIGFYLMSAADLDVLLEYANNHIEGGS